MSKKVKIKDRLSAVFGKEIHMDRYRLMCAVFPQEDYPRAWNYQSNGGPPGCVMAFEAALKRYGYWYGSGDLRNMVFRPSKGKVS